MSESRVDAKSVLALDVGSSFTRALLFDAVEGGYRFLAEGIAPTTAAAPVKDISEGVRRALDQLQTISGRRLIGEDEQLITPVSADGSGVDTFVATYSAGPPIRVVAVGLLEDISLQSARHLVSTLHARLVGKLALNDRRRIEEQIDLLMRLRPDLIIIAGGTQNGASQSILNMIEPVGLASYLMPKEARPEILYAGNGALAEEVKTRLGSLAPLHTAPNVRPSLDDEQIGPAQLRLVEVFRRVLSHRVQGVEEIDAWANNQLMPTSTAFGRVIRFLSKVYDPSKGVLGVNVGLSSTTVAASFAGDLRLSVFSELGMGDDLPRTFQPEHMNSVARWIPFEISAEDLFDYIHNRSLYPNSLPATPEEMAIDQALTREILRRALFLARRGFPAEASRPTADMLPWFEPIVATGNLLSQSNLRGQNLLTLLDGVQPGGVTTVVIDQNNLSPALGAAAASNPILTVQVLESGTFLNVGTVIAPVGRARPGTPVLRARLVYEDSSEVKAEVNQGAIEVMKLQPGRSARLHLQPLQRHDIGMGGPGRGGSLKVVGGALGIVLDGRGRPLRLPVDAEERFETLNQWNWSLSS